MTRGPKGAVIIMPLDLPLLQTNNRRSSSLSPSLPVSPISSSQYSQKKAMLDPGTKLLGNCTRSSDHTGQGRTDTCDSYEARNYGSRARKTAQHYTKYNSWNGVEVRLEPETKAGDDSGICSPPLWTTSPPRSPQHRANHYRSLSARARTEAIARGQQELMEMVKNMPESSYELTLKDLVVEQPLVETPRESLSDKKGKSDEALYRRDSSKKMSDTRTMARRSTGRIDSGGLYIKMGFPMPLRYRKSVKKNDPLINTSAKVSPKPPAPDGSAKCGVDNEWWKKRFSASRDSESGRSSSNSGSMKSSGSRSSSSSSSRSSSRHKNGGCWSFIRTMKKQSPPSE